MPRGYETSFYNEHDRNDDDDATPTRHTPTRHANVENDARGGEVKNFPIGNARERARKPNREWNETK